MMVVLSMLSTKIYILLFCLLAVAVMISTVQANLERADSGLKVYYEIDGGSLDITFSCTWAGVTDDGSVLWGTGPVPQSREEMLKRASGRREGGWSWAIFSPTPQ